ncbi:MAG: site-specific integrase [Burkholderiales bacterium]|nr:site-specific integrase [Burkholderiales bacterium]
MANQPQTIDQRRAYTRTDFTALRAFVQRVPAATIARLYFSEDDNGDPPTAANAERYLRDMQADLVALAIEHGSSVLADHLKASTKKHGSARLTAVTLKMVEEAAGLAVAAPALTHGVGMWFKPLVALRLKSVGIGTLGGLIDFCNRRGGSWWRAVPRIGVGRARRIVAWLRANEAALGEHVAPDVDEADPLRAPDSQIVEIGGRDSGVVPLERMALAHPLSGANGTNRSPAFCYVTARNDLEAIRAYLNKFRDQAKTLRSYTKELERFLLWAVSVRGKPLSSLLVDDCEAYKDFLKAPSPAFVGPRAPRDTGRWRPFADNALSADSQLYAVRALRAAFAWLVEVRYLAGNPWTAVSDPIVVRRETEMQVERALSADLWHRLRTFLDARCAEPAAHKWRTVRAALLLMGDSGLRREEVANARREAMRESTFGTAEMPIWELSVIGKRNAKRTVPVSPDTVGALRAHWADRGRALDAAGAAGPLLSPIVIPNTRRALAKHSGDVEQPYAVDAFNLLVGWAKKHAAASIEGLTASDLAQLGQASPHAFRHTFGTQAAAADVPVDVIQKMLGHQSLQTTTIYVQAEKQRMMRAAVAYYGAKPPPGED